MNKTIHSSIPRTPSKIIRIRGHHLLCLLNWKGVGYTEPFTKNYNQLVDQIKNNGAIFQIVEGKDDICAPLTPENYEGYHCDDDEIITRDENALKDINRITNLNLKIGSEFSLTENLLNELRAKFKSNDIRTACHNCSWHRFCSDIAEHNFKDTKL